MHTGSPRNALFKGDHQAEYAWFALADSLPLMSMSARRAALRIVSALEHGDAHVVLGLPARLAALANGLATGFVTRVLSAANRALPDGTDSSAQKGFESESLLVPSALTALTEEAEVRNNQR
jgi:hypothetical protein